MPGGAGTQAGIIPEEGSPLRDAKLDAISYRAAKGLS